LRWPSTRPVISNSCHSVSEVMSEWRMPAQPRYDFRLVCLQAEHGWLVTIQAKLFWKRLFRPPPDDLLELTLSQRLNPAMACHSHVDEGVLAEGVEISRFCQSLNFGHQFVNFLRPHSFRLLPIKMRQKPHAQLVFSADRHGKSPSRCSLRDCLNHWGLNRRLKCMVCRRHARWKDALDAAGLTHSLEIETTE